MKTNIPFLVRERLRQIEHQHDVKVLYACESGSRAWGFASDDSDYDVRFLYLRPLEDYLSVRPGRDTLEFALDENDLDLVGWDVRKALGLFAKSNGALLEWLYSPEVYVDGGDTLALWRALVPDVLSPKALAGHYLGMAKKTWLGSLQEPHVRLKRYLYALRSLLAARWVLSRRLPAPVAFRKLLDFSELESVVMRRIEDLLRAKQRVSETDVMPVDPVLHAFIEHQLQVLSRVLAARSARPVETRLIDAFFQDLVMAHTRESGLSTIGVRKEEDDEKTEAFSAVFGG